MSIQALHAIPFSPAEVIENGTIKIVPDVLVAKSGTAGDGLIEKSRDKCSVWVDHRFTRALA